ncbi:type II toxin-antitoxin system VapC family toxin [Tenggerimyces flavus]|uniref:Type II toxin-antitoxin system VapC family toxin n=1 Tax=Tenggerimyces flavus TaxID=1708749 RepID=A0ABV7YLH5_9ACTN|nr:type II toxin-antitoxin system VapC family toxin [Tenggerimyces flavus]MBM7785815.1 putative nucleic acid-binding protein [Tenggerimyces flavus]
MPYLLDSNVVSELGKSLPDPRLLAWYDEVSSHDLYLSALTVGEIRLGVETIRRRDPHRSRRLSEQLAVLRRSYADRIVPVTSDIADEWGRLSSPDRLPVVDGILAATALLHDWTFVTRSTKDVERTGVRLLNPFEA